MKIKKAIILGAGFGKRMYPLTKKIPKPLVKVRGVTLLENSIKFLESLGIKQIVIKGFGIFFVIGCILFPKPAPNTIAFLIFI